MNTPSYAATLLVFCCFQAEDCIRYFHVTGVRTCALPISRAEGASMITETVFESRFMHVPELARMGANVTIHHESALVRGVPKLRGAEVMATDLRASVSLAIAALAADGDTVVNRLYHLDRGY